MNTTAWLAQELKTSGRTAYDFFSDCWLAVNGSEPNNQVVVAAHQYENTRHKIQPIIPWFVCRRYDAICAAPMLDAHCGRDGVWRV